MMSYLIVQNRKGELTSAGFFGIILLVVVIVCIIALFVYLSSNGDVFSGGDGVEGLGLLVKADGGEGHVLVYDNSGDFPLLLVDSALSGDWNEFFVSSRNDLDVYCFGDSVYYSHVLKKHSFEELRDNRSVVRCPSKKVGVLDYVMIGEFSGSDGRFRINFSSSDYFRNVGVCVRWSSGILSVDTENKALVCPNMVWRNYTRFNPIDQTYDWTSDGFYACNDMVVECSGVQGTSCVLPEEDVPLRYKGVVDKCFNTGISVEQDTRELVMLYEVLDFVSFDDEIRLYVYDKDYRVLPDGSTELFSEYQGENVGGEDYMISVPYNN